MNRYCCILITFLVTLINACWSLPSVYITTILGTGTAGNTASGSAGTSTAIHTPRYFRGTTNGDIYIPDSGNHVVRRLSNGLVYAYAGTMNGAGFSGDTGPATSAALSNPYDVCVCSSGIGYILDFNNNRVRSVSTGGTIDTFFGCVAISVVCKFVFGMIIWY